MPRKLDSKTDWCESRRIATAMGVVGAGTNEPQLHAVIGEFHHDSEGGALDSSTSPVRGDLLTAASVVGAPNTCPYWQALGIGASGQVPWTAGCVIEWKTLSASDVGTVSTAYGVPSLTFSTTNSEGSTASAMRTDATVAVFDVTTPCDVDLSGAVGSGSGAARWDHQHALDQGIEAIWTASHAWDDGSGDSPALKFVGGSNDDTISIFLVDDATAGDSDLAMRLADTAGDSNLIVQDSAAASIFMLNSDGDMNVGGRSAMGDAASVSNIDTVYIDDFVSSITGTFSGMRAIQQSDCGASFTTTFIGVHGLARANTAQAQSSGRFTGVEGEAKATNATAASVNAMDGGRFSANVEDATATVAKGVLAITPAVDTGIAATGIGVHVSQGTVGAGSITRLDGLRIDNITAGDTNYSIYTSSGSCRFGDGVDITGVLTLREQAEPADPSEGVAVLWCSNGTGTGDPGDLMYKTREGGAVKTTTLVDFSTI